jgi:hypothetical protein
MSQILLDIKRREEIDRQREWDPEDILKNI